jgi:hypothetical protein
LNLFFLTNKTDFNIFLKFQENFGGILISLINHYQKYSFKLFTYKYKKLVKNIFRLYQYKINLSIFLLGSIGIG